MFHSRLIVVGLTTILCANQLAVAEEGFAVGPATRDASGFLVHEVSSTFQKGTTLIRVLIPEIVEPERKYPVVYVLPVEAGVENRYGDGLLEIKQRDLHNRFSAIFVGPTFSQLPWYADHPDDLQLRQERYFRELVIPKIEKHYPVQTTASGRLLLGFSKSGWGAFSLILRHPEQFGKAVAWDAPMMMDQPGLYGSGPIFGTPENFSEYQITQLLTDRPEPFRKEKRLMLFGYGNFRQEHQKVHALMKDLKILHDYRDGPSRKHTWHSGWVEEAVENLFSPTATEK